MKNQLIFWKVAENKAKAKGVYTLLKKTVLRILLMVQIQITGIDKRAGKWVIVLHEGFFSNPQIDVPPPVLYNLLVGAEIKIPKENLEQAFFECKEFLQKNGPDRDVELLEGELKKLLHK